MGDGALDRRLSKADQIAFSPDRPRVRQALRALEDALGGRQGVIDALATAPPDPSFDYLIGLIADPAHDTLDLGQICALGEITPGDLLTALKTTAVATAQVAAIRAVATQVPQVAADVVRRATNHYRLCSVCRGSGEVWEAILDEKGKPTGDRQKVPCEGCEGEGQVLVEASLEHQKLSLELIGLLQKGGGTQIAVAVDASQRGSGSGAIPFVDLQAAVQKVLSPTLGTIIDATPLDTTPAHPPAHPTDPTDPTDPPLRSSAPPPASWRPPVPPPGRGKELG